MTDFNRLLEALRDGKVDFIVVGGLAAIAHGSARATYDIDVVYDRSPANLDRIAAALRPFQPYLRGAPPGLPFQLDSETLRRGLNFTLTTNLGDLDLLGEISGGGTYQTLVPDTVPLEINGGKFLFLNLDRLIEVKRAAGRPRDLEAIAELEALREEKKKSL